MSVKPAERLRLGESSLPGLVVTQRAVEVGEPNALSAGPAAKSWTSHDLVAESVDFIEI